MTPSPVPATLIGMTALATPVLNNNPPILDAHRTPPDFESMDEAECRRYCRSVWAHYVRPGQTGSIGDRPDAAEVLDILRAHTPPESGPQS